MDWTWAGSEDWERRSSASWSWVSSPTTAFTMIFDLGCVSAGPGRDVTTHNNKIMRVAEFDGALAGFEELEWVLTFGFFFSK